MSRFDATTILIGVALVVGGDALSACVSLDIASLTTAKCDGGPCPSKAVTDGGKKTSDGKKAAPQGTLEDDPLATLDGGSTPEQADDPTPADTALGGADASEMDAATDGPPQGSPLSPVSPIATSPISPISSPPPIFTIPVVDGGGGDGSTVDGGFSFCNPFESTQPYPETCSEGGASRDLVATNNCSTEALDLFWLDWDCFTEQLYGTFSPGQSWVGASTVSHVWLWRNHNTGELVSSFLVQAGTGTQTTMAAPAP